MKYSNVFRLFISSLVVLLMISSQATYADTTDNIVVSVKRNLYDEKGYESACVGVQMGMLFLSKGANVTLFAALDGVELANETTLSYIDAVNNYVNKTHCVTKDGNRTLTQLVTGFTSAGGEILVCPICWVSRFTGDASAKLVEGAIMGDSDSLADTFLIADKVIDF